MPTPVVVVASGGVPIVNTPLGTPMTPVSATLGGLPVTIVDDLDEEDRPLNQGFPVHLVNDDLSEWTP